MIVQKEKENSELAKRVKSMKLTLIFYHSSGWKILFDRYNEHI